MENPLVTYLLHWGRRGSEPGAFHFPIDIAIDPADQVFITDFYNHRVQKFDRGGELLDCFDVAPNPGALALDASGNLYITHFSSMQQDEEKKPDRLTVWSASGEFVRGWGRTGTRPGEFDYPGGIAIGQNGQIYVADQTNRRVQVFYAAGVYLSGWGEYGTAPGQFGGNASPLSRVGGPQFVAVDSSGYVYTTEGSMGRIQKFTPSGEFVLAWGDNNSGPGSFGGTWNPSGSRGLEGPIGIHINKADDVWVSAACGRIQRFSTDGIYLGGFGEEKGTAPGQFLAPHGIATDSHGDLYVVDSYNHRVQKFHLQSPSP